MAVGALNYIVLTTNGIHTTGLTNITFNEVVPTTGFPFMLVVSTPFEIWEATAWVSTYVLYSRPTKYLRTSISSRGGLLRTQSMRPARRDRSLRGSLSSMTSASDTVSAHRRSGSIRRRSRMIFGPTRARRLREIARRRRRLSRGCACWTLE